MVYSTQLGTDSEGFRTPNRFVQTTESNATPAIENTLQTNKFISIADDSASDPVEEPRAATQSLMANTSDGSPLTSVAPQSFYANTPSTAKSFVELLLEEQAKNPL